MTNYLCLEPCVICDKPDCGAILILSSNTLGEKQLDEEANCLSLMCPACNRFFSVSIFKIRWLDVDEEEIARGFY